MRSQLLKVSALVLASALVAPLTFGQEEAEAEAPPPPTPQEIAAENLDQLLELVLPVVQVEEHNKELHYLPLTDQHQEELVIPLRYHRLKVILEEAQHLLTKQEELVVEEPQQQEHLQLHRLHLIQQD